MSILVFSLAVWYIAHSLVYMDGPFALLLRLRSWLDPSGIKTPGSLGQLFSCVFCMSIWVAVIFMLPWIVTSSPVEWIGTTIGLAGASAIIEAVFQFLHAIINKLENNHGM